MIVTEAAELTLRVVTVNVAVVAPAVTVTDAGTVAAEVFELASVTTAPPVGAATSRVTVPVLVIPPDTEVGDSETEANPFSIWPSQPVKIIGPQPDAVSQPATAVDADPFGSVPFVPEVMSLKTLDEPL